MAELKLIIAARIDEVPALGQFTIGSYNRDISDFQGYKHAVYTDEWMTLLLAKQVAVNEIINPIVLTSELKVITLRLMNNVFSLPNLMNLLEGWVNSAVGLTVAKVDFGIVPVRRMVRRGDVEGLNGVLGTLLTNITNNNTALVAVGYPSDGRANLAALKVAIFTDNGAQNVKERARAQLAVDNLGVLNDFLGDIKGMIWTDGKFLYRLLNKLKAKDYTLAQLIKRIRHDELHTLLAGRVLNRAGGLEVNAKIKAHPLSAGKRSKTVKSGADGLYELKGLKPVSYIITVTLANGDSFVVAGEPVTNTTVRLDLQQP